MRWSEAFLQNSVPYDETAKQRIRTLEAKKKVTHLERVNALIILVFISMPSGVFFYASRQTSRGLRVKSQSLSLLLSHSFMLFP